VVLGGTTDLGKVPGNENLLGTVVFLEASKGKR